MYTLPAGNPLLVAVSPFLNLTMEPPTRPVQADLAHNMGHPSALKQDVFLSCVLGAGDGSARGGGSAASASISSRKRSGGVNRNAGKTAIVTGAASGIGRSTAVKFAEEGWNVALIDLDHVGLKKVFKVIQGLLPDANHFIGQADLSDLRQTRRVFADIGRQYKGKADAVFANAGRHEHGTILETSETAWDRVIDANLRSAFLTVKYALPLLIANNGGSIILCGSDQSHIAKRASFAYGITKAAIAQMTRSLAVDFASKNIRVNCVCPGTIDTPLVTKAISRVARQYGIPKNKIRERLESAQPIQRLGRPEEVASIVYFLAGSDASYVTGAFWAIDGGYTAQ